MVRSHRGLRLVGSLVALVSALLSNACGGAAGYKSAAPAASPNAGGYGANASYPTMAAQESAKSSSAPGGAPAAPAMQPSAAEASPAPSPPHDSASVPTPTERPGLGTEWGESRTSYVQERSFIRGTPSPSGTGMLYYNDREGSRAMTRYADYRDAGYASVQVPGVPVTISLRDQSGAQLPAYFANGNTYAIGEAGQNYKIVIRNDANFQIEAVTSVDGLDVMDGRDASYNKRGYLVPAYSSIEVEGFRQSSSAVAAFRFGSVRDSYAARTGSSRNVGVIGVAVFAPRGAVWTDREIERRHNADPFPGKYAAPPPPR